MNNAVPSLFEQQGYQLHLIIQLILMVVVFAVGYLLWRVGRRVSKKNDLDGDGWLVVSAITSAFAVLWLLVFVAQLIPYNTQYWHYYTVEADVVSVSNVITEASGNLTRQPVVVLEGMDRPVVVDDPRAVDLEGKHAFFRCTIEWHYQAADTYNCKIVDYTEAEK